MLCLSTTLTFSPWFQSNYIESALPFRFVSFATGMPVRGFSNNLSSVPCGSRTELRMASHPGVTRGKLLCPVSLDSSLGSDLSIC
jgi:hypothetical protein